MGAGSITETHVRIIKNSYLYTVIIRKAGFINVRTLTTLSGKYCLQSNPNKYAFKERKIAL